MDLTADKNFESMEEAKVEIKKFCIKNFHQYQVKYSNPTTFTVVCKVDCCPFKISCNKRLDQRVYISKFTLQHTCDLVNNETKVTAAFVAESLLVQVSDNPEISIGHIRNCVKRENNLSIGYTKAYRAKKIAHETAFGNIEESFKKIPSFVEAVCAAGGTAIMDTEHSRFKRCFICLKACKNALNFSLPILFVDACHIKNEYNGVVLAACSIDGNGQLVPIAYGIADIEDNNNWNWFMENLQISNCIIIENKYSFISYQEKGIMKAIFDVFHGCQQCFCVKHIEKNVKKRLDGRLVVSDLWGAARTSDPIKFQKKWKTFQRKVFNHLNI